MTRWLVGSFDPSGRLDSTRLARALAPQDAHLLEMGPLRVSYTGSRGNRGAPACLLDGFLDNAAELSAELELAPGTDPEKLLAIGWQHWGRGLFARMRGDFAVVIWDEERREGVIARDQLGVRSLFLHQSSEGLRFASEIKHLLALLPHRPEPDRASVAHWLAMSNRPGSATLYRGIRRLAPGSALLIGGEGIQEERYWEPRYAEPLSEAEPELARLMRTGLDQAVRRRIGSGGSTGILMSGGLDSSSVAAVAATEASGRISAYSGTFPEHPLVDESGLIEELRTALKLPGITAVVRPGGLLASAVEAVREWEMPLLGWGDFWTTPLLRAAAGAGVGVMLGGDGGDELFGSRSFLLADRLRAGHPFEAIALARELPGAGDRPPRREVARLAAELAVAGAAPYRMHEILRAPAARREAPSWMRPEIAEELRQTDDPLAWKRLDGPRWWAHTAHGIARRVDEIGVFEHQRRRAASAGLQARHPLFDLDLVELALRQPPRATFDRYRSRPVLRAAMADVLPESVRMRPQKAWFDSVIVDCLAGPDGSSIRRLLGDPGAQIRAFVDPHALERQLLAGAPTGPRAGSEFRWLWQTWRLVTAECWLRAQADTPPSALPNGIPVSLANVELRPA